MSARGPARGASGYGAGGGEADGAIGGDAMVVEETGAWTGKKKAKIQSAPTSEDVDMTAPVISTEPGPDQEGFDWKQVEGFDWTYEDVKEEVDSYGNYFGLPELDDAEFWALNDDQQTEQVQRRLAIAHIRAHKFSAGLNDAQLLSILEKDGPFRPYERHPKWTFDTERFRIAGFQDYQRLILHNDHFYQDWPFYYNSFSTLESDQQFVRLWDQLLDKTRWLRHFHKLAPQERRRICRVTYYHAAKIKADYPQIYSRLLCPFTLEFLDSVTTDHFYARLYFEVWKRVAKQKMDLKDALDEVKERAMWPFHRPEVEGELESDNYKTCVDAIDKNLEEDEAYWLIFEAVRKLVLRLKTYYEYATTKLDIADKMGLV